MVNVVDRDAPGELERVRTLLNTWRIPNDTRQPTDVFRGAADVRELRDDLRRVVEGSASADHVLNSWVRRAAVTPRVVDGQVTYQGRGAVATFCGIVLTAIAHGTWQRLKACPDCHWAFYDYTRNGSKRWCVMTAGGPGGRSCGSIAKVRAYRARTAAR
ncbi:MAG TPA: CGNR zinc finger domain-containing protein [Micromonosporaceae bacterium]